MATILRAPNHLTAKEKKVTPTLYLAGPFDDDEVDGPSWRDQIIEACDDLEITIVDPRNDKVVGRFPNLVKEPFPLPAELRFAFDGEASPQVRLPLHDGDVDPARAVLAPGFRVERRACASQEPQPWR